MNQEQTKRMRFERALGFHKTPRMVGMIHKLVLNKEQYKAALSEMRAVSSIPFVSVYSYKSFIPFRGSLEPSSVLIDKIPFDYDIDDYDSDADSSHLDIDSILPQLEKKKEQCLKDAQRFIDDYDMTVGVVFSGGKGFHLYVILKDELFKTFPDDNYQTATDYLFSAQVFLDKHRHSDDSVKGMINGMIRLPNERYISKFGITDRYSIPLTLNEMEYDIQDIIAMSRQGRRKVYIDVPKKLMTISEMREVLDFEIKTSRVRITKWKGQPVFENNGNIYKEFIDHLLKHYPCVANAIKAPNPSHTARVNAVMHMAEILTGDTETKIEVIEEILSGMDWVDFNPMTTHKQVMSILYKEKRYRAPRCTKLKMQNFCIGEACPYYYE